MRKYFLILAVAAFLIGCNNNSESISTTDSTTSTDGTNMVVPVDTNQVGTDSASTKMTTTTTTDTMMK